MSTDQVSADRRRASAARISNSTAAARRRASLARRHASPAAIRLLDVAGAALLLCLLALPMLLIAALVRLGGRGPVIYTQERTGLRGKPFVMYKFRTMRVDAESATGPVWATRKDPRRTLLGIILRRTSLDELPQLYNVLLGDMSLVGPRPERPCFVKAFSQRLPAYNQRHQVPPGITGWAQVNGWRGDSSLEKRLEFDLDYVARRSVWLNLRIMLLTPFRMLLARNAC